MYPTSSANQARPFLTWQRISDWAQEHYRCRTFVKDERIPSRPGLLYLVQRGAVRLTGNAQLSVDVMADEEETPSTPLMAQDEEAFLGFVGPGQPFEIIAQSPFSLQSFAHVDQTAVIWLYWHD